jgi:hypothetical protein
MRIALLDGFPELARVVHVDGMTELVNEHIVDQLERQLHERDVEADSTAAATASPAAAGVREADLVVTVAALFGKIRQPLWQVAFGLYAQRLDHYVADTAGGGGIVRSGTFGERSDDLLAVARHAGFRSGNRPNDKRVAFADLHAVFERSVAVLFGEHGAQLLPRGLDEPFDQKGRRIQRQRSTESAVRRNPNTYMRCPRAAPESNAAKFFVDDAWQPRALPNCYVTSVILAWSYGSGNMF